MEVVVKELSSAAVDVLAAEDIVAFQREEQLQARLEHGNVAHVYAMTEGESVGAEGLPGCPWLACETFAAADSARPGLDAR
jgi:hypothetical protein